MKSLVVITHTPHWVKDNVHYAYGPYVREMNIWINQVDETTVVAPMGNLEPSEIHWRYDKKIKQKLIPGISLIGFRQKVKAFLSSPLIFFTIFKAMRQADHIHLRCPGNIGLIGCIAQICFPRKRKTAKYAGNWDPQSKQPWSYRLQKWILNNTFLTRNMHVLVYGEWSGVSKNIRPFFTASYSENIIPEQSAAIPFNAPYRFLFVGSLVSGKRPEYAIGLMKHLKERNFNATLDVYGDGVLRKMLEQSVKEEELQDSIRFHGNQSAEVVCEAYQQSHFLILPSKSEGWPKVVAEAMFWGCAPIVSAISCVPWMLNNEERGLLLSMDMEADEKKISSLLQDTTAYENIVKNASNWSRQFTLETFEKEIQAVL